MVPVGGDQLTRVRLDGAKSLRAGAHTRAERFENLCPILVEMFHMQMDFLEVIIHTGHFVNKYPKEMLTVQSNFRLSQVIYHSLTSCIL